MDIIGNIKINNLYRLSRVRPRVLALLIRAGKRSSRRADNQSSLSKKQSVLLETIDFTHSNAFGLGIRDSDFEKFVEYSDEVLKDMEFSPSYKVDYIFSMQSLEPQTILEIGGMKSLWGQNIEEALVVVENIPVSKDMLTLMSRDKNPTLKIQLPNGVSCIKFRSSEEEFDSLYTENGCVNITVIGKCEVNRYFSSMTPQILIEDYEILDKQEWYF